MVVRRTHAAARSRVFPLPNRRIFGLLDGSCEEAKIIENLAGQKERVKGDMGAWPDYARCHS